ncbi:MAG: RidA family protein [Streptosporangiaceae bacterium]
MSSVSVKARRELRVASIAEPISHYTDAVIFGDLVFVSGAVGSDATGRILQPDDVVAQARQALRNIGDVLAAAGTGFENVLKVTVLLTDVADRAPINAVRKEFFGSALPASTLIGVAALALPDAKVEIEAIACLPQTD